MKSTEHRTQNTARNAIFLLVSLTAALLIWLGHVNPVWVILATIMLTLSMVAIVNRKSSNRK